MTFRLKPVLFVAVTENAPTNPEDYCFVTFSARTPELIKFKGDEGVQIAQILLRWVNPKGEPAHGVSPSA